MLYKTLAIGRAQDNVFEREILPIWISITKRTE